MLRPRTGLSIVELLVAIAIIGIIRSDLGLQDLHDQGTFPGNSEASGLQYAAKIKAQTMTAATAAREFICPTRRTDALYPDANTHRQLGNRLDQQVLDSRQFQ